MIGQSEIMEYIVLTFFILIVVIVLMFFLIGYQVGQLSLKKHGNQAERALTLTKQISSSPLFVREDGVFDDGKLTALKMLSGSCEELEKFFGKDWFFEVTVFDEDYQSGSIKECGQYPECNYWSFCKQDLNTLAFDIPVSVHRVSGIVLQDSIIPRTDIGLLKVGVYVQ